METVRTISPTEQLLRFFIKFAFYIVAYLPFILVGIFFAFHAMKLTKGGFITGTIGFVIGMGLLLVLVRTIHSLQVKFKAKGNPVWYLFMIINLFVVTGLPFIAGGGIGLNLFKNSIQNLFEKSFVFLLGGFLFAIPAYWGVIKNKGIKWFPSETTDQ